MIKLSTQLKTKFVLSLITKANAKNANIIKQENVITEFIEKKEGFIYSEKGSTKDNIKDIMNIVANTKRDYQIDISSFINKNISEELVLEAIYEGNLHANPVIYSAKTKKPKSKTIEIINVSADGKKIANKLKVLTEAKEIAMDLQITPPNILNSVSYAKKVQTIFSKDTSVSVKVLTKKEITANKMGLLLSVNLGSAYDPRVVIIEYKGNLKSKDKTAIVGKGITFDAGGYNIKTGPHMAKMKFDMSGSASVVGAMKAIAKLKPKSNVVGILVMTDNMINSKASTPDAVFHAMNGKSVEINNTDAEGRLALADGMVYAVKKLNATRTITIATLTGAVISALGSTYSGVWSTTDKGWKDIDTAATRANELVWRMPLHKDYFKYMSGSKVADMFNTDLTGKGGSSSAAMFLSQFAEGSEFIHFDVAGTADVDGIPKAAMVKTLFEVVNG